jgi:branched-chain amino acid transport system substrate-binding protein
VTGGDFFRLTGGDLSQVDFSVVQTFSFFRADPAMAARVLGVSERLFGLGRPEQIESPVGLGHAYDLTHILARAIELAGSTDRAAVRSALEQVRDHRGLVRYFARPFAPRSHEALGPDDLFMGTYNEEGVIVPLPLTPHGDRAGSTSSESRSGP